MRRSEPAGFLHGAAAWLWGAAWVLACASPAAAQRGLGLNWVRLAGAESCTTGGELINRLEQKTDRILFVRTGEAALTIDGYVYPVDVPEGWAVTFEISAADGRVLGHRDLGVLRGKDCSVVADAATLILDLTLDPEGSLAGGIPLSPSTRGLLDAALRDVPTQPEESAQPGGRDEPSPPQPPPPSRAPATPLPTPPASAAGEPPVFAAAGNVTLGVMPGAAFGAGVSASLPAGGLQLELGVTSFPSARRGEDDRRADFELLFGAVGLCALQPLSGLWLCAGVEYGSQRVAPSALASARSVNEPLIDLTAYGSLRIPLLGPLLAQARLGLVVPLLRNAYHYGSTAGESRLYRMPALGLQGALGLGLRL